MNKTRERYYDEWREKYEDDPARAVGWRNQESLDARFYSTLDHMSHKDFTGVSILDVGCGASLNLLRYLPDQGYYYLGIDCNEGSLQSASRSWGIPYNEDINFCLEKQLIKDEYLTKVRDTAGFDIILAQGIYQEFDDIYSIKDHVVKLSKLLNPGGELLIMTPSNRVLDADGPSVLKISAHDAINILEETRLPYELFLGELGEHLILRVYKKED